MFFGGSPGVFDAGGAQSATDDNEQQREPRRPGDRGAPRSGSAAYGPGFDTLSVAGPALPPRAHRRGATSMAPDTILTADNIPRRRPPGAKTASRPPFAMRGRGSGCRRRGVDRGPPPTSRPGPGSAAAAPRLWPGCASTSASRRRWTRPICWRWRADVEGHPDNAAASLLGGLTVSCQRDDGRVTARAWRGRPTCSSSSRTPDAELETAHARRVLPATRLDARRRLQPAARAAAGPCARVRARRRPPRGAARPLAPAGARGRSCRVWPTRWRSRTTRFSARCLSGAGPSIVAVHQRTPTARGAEVSAAETSYNAPRHAGYTIRTALPAHQPCEPC